MLQPRRTKFRKQMRGRMTGKESRGVELEYGDFGLQALEPCWMTARQLEAARRAVVRFCKRRGQQWIRVFPDKPVTQKAAETRMGKGKGSVDHWVAVVKPGRIIMEVGGLPEDVAREALRLAAYKLPIKTHIVRRFELGATESADERAGAAERGAERAAERAAERERGA